MVAVGYTEYLCDNGHYWTVSSEQFFHGITNEHLTCKHCSYPYAFVSKVGKGEGSSPAPRIEYGWEDVPQTDHYKNRYFTKMPLFLPDVKSHRWVVAHHQLPVPAQRTFHY